MSFSVVTSLTNRLSRRQKLYTSPSNQPNRDKQPHVRRSFQKLQMINFWISFLSLGNDSKNKELCSVRILMTLILRPKCTPAIIWKPMQKSKQAWKYRIRIGGKELSFRKRKSVFRKQNDEKGNMNVWEITTPQERKWKIKTWAPWRYSQIQNRSAQKL